MTKKYVMVDWNGRIYVMTEEEYQRYLEGEIGFDDLFD